MRELVSGEIAFVSGGANNHLSISSNNLGNGTNYGLGTNNNGIGANIPISSNNAGGGGGHINRGAAAACIVAGPGALYVAGTVDIASGGTAIPLSVAALALSGVVGTTLDCTSAFRR